MVGFIRAATLALCAGLRLSAASPTVTTLELAIPDTHIRDKFYAVNANFSGQTLPLLLDTGSADILVASDECNNKKRTSGCYKSKLFQISKDIDIVPGKKFGTIVGSGAVVGNQSYMDVSFGEITINHLAVPLIYSAAKTEFEMGAFSGILGMGMLNVSREYHYFQQLPPFNKMAADNQLSKPVFSLTVPRYADPASPKTGTMTLGGIQSSEHTANITYSDIIRTQDSSAQGWTYQTWTQEVQGFRVNGHDIALPKKGLGEQGQFIATMDTGGEYMAVTSLFNEAVKYFKGKLEVTPDVWVYFDCSQPQLVEFKMNNQWIPIDPLDMIQPGDVKTVNGTEMCKATLQSGNDAFSNVLLGPQIFRNALTVFDYVSEDLFSVPPRIGLAPTTNAAEAVKRYPSLYKKRLH